MKNFLKKVTNCTLNVLNRCQTWLYKRLQDNSEASKDVLSPVIDVTSPYVPELKRWIDDPNVHNIALTGIYGSGKSSIIKSYQHLHPEDKSLNISLAYFLEKKVKENNEQQEITEEKLEYSLVQQFFYHVKSSKIKSSRFHRIHETRWYIHLLVTILAISEVVASIILFCPTIFTDFSSIVNLQDSNIKWVQLTALFYFSLCTCGIIWLIIGYIFQISLNKIKISNNEIEFQKNNKISVFNKYLDELVYMFQKTHYKVVFIEDLDRFKRIDILSKLRELNFILNQSKDINRRIVFVYALHEGSFNSGGDKTKFFDKIIPVLPKVNIQNSADIFVQYCQEHIDSNKLSKDFILDIAPFIDDFRALKSIISEFRTKLSLKIYYQDISYSKLLSMILYKYHNPEDYENIHTGKSLIDKVFKDKKDLVEDNILQLKEEIDNEKYIIESANKELLRSKEEIISLLIFNTLKAYPQGTLLCDKNHNMINLENVLKLNNVVEVEENIFYVYHTDFRPSYYKEINFQQALSKSNQSLSQYKDRIILVGNEKNKTINACKNRIVDIQEEINKIQMKSLRELCINDPQILIKHFPDLKKNALLDFLLRRGYIDEKYMYYVTSYDAEGVLNQSDHQYLMDIKSLKKDSEAFNLTISNPKEVLRYIRPEDFACDMILNPRIAHQIMSEPNYPYKVLFLDKLLLPTINVSFICNYALNTEYQDDSLIAELFNRSDYIWQSVSESPEISDEVKGKFAKVLIFLWLRDKKILNSLDYDKLFSAYVSQVDYIDLFSDIPTSSVIELLKSLDVKFKQINPNTDQELLQYIINSNSYKLNPDNIKLIISKVAPNIDLSIYNNKIYTLILKANIDALLNYINENFLEFFRHYILQPENNIEEEEAMVSLLTKSSISEDRGIEFIKHNSTILSDPTVILYYGNYIREFYRVNKISPKLDNLNFYITFFQIDKLDEILLQYIKLNEEALIQNLNDTNSISKELYETLIYNDQVPLALKKALIDDQRCTSYWKEEPEALPIEALKHVIEKKKIAFTPETFNAILEVNDELLVSLVFRYSKEIKENIQDLDLSVKHLLTIVHLIKGKKNKQFYYNLLQSKKVDSNIDVESILTAFLEYQLQIEFSYLIFCIHFSKNNKLNLQCVLEFMGTNNVSEMQFQEITEEIGGEFTSLRTPGKQFKVSKDESNERFIKELQQREYVSIRKSNAKDKDKDKITLYTRKRG